MSRPHSPTSSNPSPKSSSANLGSRSAFTAPAPAPDSASESASDLPSALPELRLSDNSRAGLSFAGPSGGGRRTSVQFAARQDGGRRPASPKPHPPPSQRRMSSPPPPLTYEDRVSFDTFQNRDATDLSFTLISKHKNYFHTARSRTFLCGTDQNDYSEFALEWLVDELVEDGDEIVCLRVVDKDSKINSDASLHEEKYKIEARKFLDQIQAKNHDDAKSISLILEFAVGRVPETIQRMISIYAPACLIVGTRGRSLGGIQGLLPGSVSKYCLQNSPVPVIVVRPSDKREKKKKKRLADPSRRTYQDIIDQSGLAGQQTLDKSEREKVIRQSIGEASEREAAAVAEAIGASSNNTGLFAKFRNERRGDSEAAPLHRVSSGRSEYAAREETPSPVGGLSPDDPLPGEKWSPEFEKLDSPAMSDDEPDEVDEVNSGERGSGGNVTDVRAARKMEAGEGKYLKPDSSITEDT